MIIGPVFARELATAPRRPRFYVYRALYAAALLLLMCTAWSILAGTQIVRSIGDMARFGAILFQILASLQLTVLIFFSAMVAASSVAQEKDRRTLDLLLVTRLGNHELVLGKLMASLLHVLVMLAAGLPLLALATLLGGVSFAQVGRAYAVTAVSVLAAGSLGSTIAFWREKTFQTLAMTSLAIVFWLGTWEAVAAGLLGRELAGISCETWASGFSPLRAIVAATRWRIAEDPLLGPLGNPVNLYLVSACLVAAGLNVLATVRVRAWNPSREVRSGQTRQRSPRHQEPRARREPSRAAGDWPSGGGPTVASTALAGQEVADQERARAQHVDARLRPPAPVEESREVWDNPILWREMRTRAYGRKLIVIRVAYTLLFVGVLVAVSPTLATGAPVAAGDELGTVLPALSKPLVPFFLVSLVILNALAVTSITTERDGRSLDLLLVSDISPEEFIFGKLAGILWVAREMVLLPILVCVGLCWTEGLTLENLLYMLAGLLVMDVFVATLGLHCGMTYANSRTAISVSLGTVFFLFLGVVTSILMMISFSGSFEVQLGPFVAFIVGGGVGLYASLGARNPSAAIALASLVVPFATFYAVVSFVLDHAGLTFLVTVAAYGFSTAAMLVPALGEFDFAMGRTTAGEE